PPSPRSSRGEGKGEGRRRLSRKLLPVACCRNEAQIGRFDWLKPSIQRRNDGFNHCFSIDQRIDIPKAQNGPSLLNHDRVALPIISAADVLTSIQLDDQLFFAAGEIREVWPDRELAGELMPVQSAV